MDKDIRCKNCGENAGFSQNVVLEGVSFRDITIIDENTWEPGDVETPVYDWEVNWGEEFVCNNCEHMSHNLEGLIKIGFPYHCKDCGWEGDDKFDHEDCNGWIYGPIEIHKSQETLINV
jgi:hypothetical protein